MKVIQVIDTLNRGGAERVTVDLSNLLHRKGHQVSVLTLLEEGPVAAELDQGIEKINLARKNKFSLVTARRLISILNQFEVAHLHMRHTLKYYFFCSLFFTCRAKIVFHDHYGDIGLDRSVPFYLRRLKNKIGYVPVSRHLAQWAREEAGIPAKRIFLLANIVVLDFVTSPAKRPRNKLLMISNFRRTKNIEFALKIIKSISETGPVTLDVYGRELDPGYLTELRELTNELGLTDSVQFLVNEHDVRAKMSEYGLAIHTAVSETGPLVLIEYLACQLPFLSYRTGEVAEQLAPDLPAYFVDTFVPEVWLAHLRDLMSEKIVYTEAFVSALFDRYYSSKNYVQACEEIYAHMIRP